MTVGDIQQLHTSWSIKNQAWLTDPPTNQLVSNIVFVGHHVWWSRSMYGSCVCVRDAHRVWSLRVVFVITRLRSQHLGGKTFQLARGSGTT